MNRVTRYCWHCKNPSSLTVWLSGCLAVYSATCTCFVVYYFKRWFDGAAVPLFHCVRKALILGNITRKLIWKFFQVQRLFLLWIKSLTNSGLCFLHNTQRVNINLEPVSRAEQSVCSLILLHFFMFDNFSIEINLRINLFLIFSVVKSEVAVLKHLPKHLNQLCIFCT